MQIMNMGNYAHGNQPVQHALYLYDWCGQPWKTQRYVREVMERLYKPTPDGYCGDEDNGQTSAWYVFSALGFYPVCPASCEYAIGSPLFRKATVNLPSGKKIIISTSGNTPDNVYVKKLRLNGRAYSKNYLTHEQLVSGARIKVRMSAEPCYERGIREGDFPYSYSNE
jgi:predicted alpha-1,2-mannosidase